MSPPVRRRLLALCALFLFACTLDTVFAQDSSSSTADAVVVMDSSSAEAAVDSSTAEAGLTLESSSAEIPVESSSAEIPIDSSSAAAADMSSSAESAIMDSSSADATTAADSSSAEEMMSSAEAAMDSSSAMMDSTAADAASSTADMMESSSAMDMTESSSAMDMSSAAEQASSSAMDAPSSTADMMAESSSAMDMMESSSAMDMSSAAEMDSSSAADAPSSTADMIAESSSAMESSSAEMMSSSAEAAMDSSSTMMDSTAADAASSTADMIAESSSAMEMSSADTAIESSSALMEESSSAVAESSSAVAESSSAVAESSSAVAESSSAVAESSSAAAAESSSAAAAPSSSADAGVESSSSTASMPDASSTGSAPTVTSTYFARADMFSGSVETSPLLNLTVLFSQSAPGADVTITVTIFNLPAGVYGFHIHTYGDVTTKNGINTTITGGHFNPLNRPHACWPAMDRQVGDIGNLTSTGVNGEQVVFVRNLIELSTNNQSVIGRSVILHKLPDTCGQPTGAAGTYWAEGVIGIAAPPAPYTENLAASAGVSMPFTGEALMVAVPSAFPVVAMGTVSFATQPSGLVRIVAAFSGLPASVTLAMHVHVWGDVSSRDGGATSLHYNPTNVSHALYPTVPRHMGDIGNVVVTDANGNAWVDCERDLLSLTATTGNIIGRGVVVHSGMDNGSQPTGASGSKYLVGVIGISSRVQPPPSPPMQSSSTGAPMPAPSSSAAPAAMSSTADNGANTTMSSTGSVAPVPASDAIKVTVFFTAPIEYFTTAVLTDLRAAIAASMGITDVSRIEITVVTAAPTSSVHTLQAMLLPAHQRKVTGTQLSFLVLPGAAGDAITPTVAVASFTSAFQNATSPLRTAAVFSTVDASIAPSTAPVSPCADGTFTTPCPSGGGGSPASSNDDDKRTGVIIGVIVGVSLALVIILLLSKRFCCAPQRFKEFSGVELQYDESVRAGGAPPVGLTPNPASGRMHQGQELTFEAVSDEPLPDRFPHRASIV